VYTYEYQGNAPKLVHTPLTDKCYLTLTQGMAMGCGGACESTAQSTRDTKLSLSLSRGRQWLPLCLCASRVAAGNPYGPAGTGKTESVKALGAALGRQVLVFNCDEGIDFQSMVRAPLLSVFPLAVT
jgi:dynein heavy chain 2